MSSPILFDHIEVHVSNILLYCDFLVKLFGGGRYKVISENGTAMFCSFDGLNIEIKKRVSSDAPIASGFCNPCLRLENAKAHIEKTMGLTIEKEVQNPDGPCYFFKDHEHILWHAKSYLVRDRFVNW